MFHMALIAAPGVAAVACAGRRGVQDNIVLVASGMVVSGASAMLAFWAYFSVHALGLIVSCSVPIVSVIVVCWNGMRPGGLPSRQLLRPVGLWVLATLFILSLGFLHGGTAQPIQMASTRFSHPLPIDNFLPQYFAEGIYKLGNFRAPPPFGQWLSSDRPPLQMGYVLAARPWPWSSPGIHYQLVSVALQQTWLVGLWALLIAARVRVITAGFVLCATLLSDIAIVHGFFVWPKLVAVGFLLMAASLILTDRWATTSSALGMGALVGSLFALAMLCHGTSVYGVIPLALIAVLRKRPTRRFVAGFAAMTALFYFPWIAYQHIADPPGNQLEKWQLGGQLALDHRSALDVIVGAYEHAGISQTLDNKLRNVNTITGGAQGVRDIGHAIGLALSGRFDDAVATARHVRFFSLLQSIGLLLIAPGALLILRARCRPPLRAKSDWTLSLTCFWAAGIGCAAWVLLQFGNEAAPTYLHTGSLLIPMLTIIACVAGLASFSTRLAGLLVALNAVLVLVLYVPSLTPMPGTSYSPFFAVAGVICLAEFVTLAFRSAAAPPDGGRASSLVVSRGRNRSRSKSELMLKSLTRRVLTVAAHARAHTQDHACCRELAAREGASSEPSVRPPYHLPVTTVQWWTSSASNPPPPAAPQRAS
jgi:hypothetical protein